MNNYFLLHGSFGSPFSNWIPYLRKKIEKQNGIVYTPDMPTGVGVQTYENWERILLVYADCGLLNENTIIFAHSIAPVFISKFLVKNKLKVKRLVFVCGFNQYFGINEEYDTVNESMYFTDLAAIKNYCSDIVCFYTDNDPYVKMTAEKEFADIVSTTQIMIPSGGHLNSESGYEEFSELLPFLE